MARLTSLAAYLRAPFCSHQVYTLAGLAGTNEIFLEGIEIAEERAFVSLLARYVTISHHAAHSHADSIHADLPRILFLATGVLGLRFCARTLVSVAARTGGALAWLRAGFVLDGFQYPVCELDAGCCRGAHSLMVQRRLSAR